MEHSAELYFYKSLASLFLRRAENGCSNPGAYNFQLKVVGSFVLLENIRSFLRQQKFTEVTVICITICIREWIFGLIFVK